jgi:hypothetical protein
MVLAPGHERANLQSFSPRQDRFPAHKGNCSRCGGDGVRPAALMEGAAGGSRLADELLEAPARQHAGGAGDQQGGGQRARQRLESAMGLTGEPGV